MVPAYLLDLANRLVPKVLKKSEQKASEKGPCQKYPKKATSTRLKNFFQTRMIVYESLIMTLAIVWWVKTYTDKFEKLMIEVSCISLIWAILYGYIFCISQIRTDPGFQTIEWPNKRLLDPKWQWTRPLTRSLKFKSANDQSKLNFELNITPIWNRPWARVPGSIWNWP